MERVTVEGRALVRRAGEAGRAARERLEAWRRQRAREALLRDLGAAVYDARLGRGGPAADERIGHLLTQLRGFEPAAAQPPASVVLEEDDDAEPGNMGVDSDVSAWAFTSSPHRAGRAAPGPEPPAPSPGGPPSA